VKPCKADWLKYNGKNPVCSGFLAFCGSEFKRLRRFWRSLRHSPWGLEAAGSKVRKRFHSEGLSSEDYVPNTSFVSKIEQFSDQATFSNTGINRFQVTH
jgi:hypothetical protein